MNTVILTGGNINKKHTKEYLEKYSFDLIIAVDKGLETLNKFGINPDYIIGDFDSIDKEILDKYKNEENIKTIYLNAEKDYTDTHMALKLAIDLKSTEIVILRWNRKQIRSYNSKYPYSKRMLRKRNIV